jgi:hypothetical protein
MILLSLEQPRLMPTPPFRRERQCTVAVEWPAEALAPARQGEGGATKTLDLLFGFAGMLLLDVVSTAVLVKPGYPPSVFVMAALVAGPPIYAALLANVLIPIWFWSRRHSLGLGGLAAICLVVIAASGWNAARPAATPGGDFNPFHGPLSVFNVGGIGARVLASGASIRFVSRGPL